MSVYRGITTEEYGPPNIDEVEPLRKLAGCVGWVIIAAGRASDNEIPGEYEDALEATVVAWYDYIRHLNEREAGSK